MYFDTWDIDITTDKENVTKLLIDDFKNCKNDKESLIYFFLDVYKKEFSLLEKLLYDTALFHFKRLGLDINDENYQIECWNHCRDSNGDQLHLDNDTINSYYESCKPILTTIIYVNDISNPTLILDIDNNCFSKREYKNRSAYLSFPKMLKTVAFHGGDYYHGAINFLNQQSIRDDRYIYAMNVWFKTKLPGVVPYSQSIYKNNMLYHKNIFYIDKKYNLFSFKKNKIKNIYVNKLPYKFLLHDHDSDCNCDCDNGQYISKNGQYICKEITDFKDWSLNPYQNSLFIRKLKIDKEIFLLEFQEVISKLELDIYHDYHIVVKP